MKCIFIKQLITDLKLLIGDNEKPKKAWRETFKSAGRLHVNRAC